MTISKEVIQNIEKGGRIIISDDLKQYLIATYSDDPFPHEYSEQDLYTNIYRDIHAYETGKLDVTTKSPSERRQQECENLKALYIEKCQEVQNLRLYVDELERILLENNIESDKMKEDRISLLSL